MFNIPYPFPLPEVGHCHHDQARSLFKYQRPARQLIEGSGFYQNWLLSSHQFIHCAIVAVVERARIVLRPAAGEPDNEIAQGMGVTAGRISQWCERFLALGLSALRKCTLPSEEAGVSSGSHASNSFFGARAGASESFRRC